MRYLSFLLITCLILVPISAVASDCIKASALKLGEPAPCNGVLITSDDAKELIILSRTKNLYEQELKTCNYKLTMCINKEIVIPVTPWYKSPIFWGVIGVVSGFALGIGTGVAVYWQLR